MFTFNNPPDGATDPEVKIETVGTADAVAATCNADGARSSASGGTTACPRCCPIPVRPASGGAPGGGGVDTPSEMPGNTSSEHAVKYRLRFNARAHPASSSHRSVG